MLIDWFTVVAQIVNFMVLVALLRRFLFSRLVEAMDAREQRIAARLAESEHKTREAEQRVAAAQEEAAQIQEQRGHMIAEARQAAESEHKELLLKARESVRVLESKWHEDVEREKSAFLDEVRSRAAAEILAIARQALADLACADLQHCAIEAFLRKVQNMDPANLGEEVVVRSGGELPPDARSHIEKALQDRLGSAVRFRFERAPQMTWGLELRTNGRRIGWNPESYIGSLEENLRGALEHRSR